MKKLLIIILTFVIAFVTTLLFDLQFINTNFVRKGLVTLLIIIEIIIGFLVLKNEALKSIK